MAWITSSTSGVLQTSYASSILAGDESLSIPSAPKESADKAPFVCPYCRLVITIKNTKDWARHVFRDLMPYVCLYPDCSTPSKLYESRRQWYHHMCEAHSISNTNQNGSDCPLCLVDLRPPLTFERHVGHHLEQLALFILPRADPEDEAPSENLPKVASVQNFGRSSDSDSMPEGQRKVPLYNEQIPRLDDLRYVGAWLDSSFLEGGLLDSPQDAADLRRRTHNLRDLHSESTDSSESHQSAESAIGDGLQPTQPIY